jgi:hypothetical protein
MILCCYHYQRNLQTMTFVRYISTMLKLLKYFIFFKLTFSHYNSFVSKMYTDQKTVIHNVFLLEKIAVLVDLSASTNWTSTLTWKVKLWWFLTETSLTHLWNSWYQCFCNLNIKLRSRSFKIVYSSISVCGLSVVRPRDEPFRSNLLWIKWSEQNRFPIMTKRTWVVHQRDHQA